MKRIISFLLISLLLLSGCKKEKDEVVNQNLVTDSVEFSPDVVQTETKEETKEDSKPAPAPVPESKPDIKPEPTPEPELVTEVEFKAFNFQVSKNSVAGIEVPPNQVITSLEQLDKYDTDFKKFYTSHSDASLNKGFKRRLRYEYEFKTFSTDDCFDVLKEKDILVFSHQFTRASCEYDVTSVLSNGEVNVEITEYWKDSDLYGYNYIVFVIEVPKGSVDKVTSVKTTTKKASDDTYIDFESRKVSVDYHELNSKPFSVFEVIGSVEQLSAHMNKYSALFENGYFYGSDISRYTDEYFNKNVIAFKTFIGSSSTFFGVQAITDQGEMIYYCRSGNALATDIKCYAVITEVERSLLKGELHINKETYIVDEHIDGSLK